MSSMVHSGQEAVIPTETEAALVPFPFGKLQFPTDEEMHAIMLAKYERVSPTFIDRWPESVRALSFKTKLIEVDPAKMRTLWEVDFEVGPFADELAQTLDAEMGWASWFVRLNSRSPKDMTAPQMPVTVSGKQAVWWMIGSERILDDVCMFFHARKPMYVCLREFAPMHEDGEFRCFAKGGKVLAVSRYFYQNTAPLRCDPNRIMAAAAAFYDAHLREHFADIVFDLYAPGGSEELLIEINPYGLSDPCCFGSYEAIETIGGVRLSCLADSASGPSVGTETQSVGVNP